MRSRTSRSSVARTASLTRSPGLGPTASSRVGSAAIAINSMALMASPCTASWLTRTRSGAGRATMVPRTSYAAGRRMVPQRPAANAASSAPKRSATSARRRILLAALSDAEDVVGPSEILGRQDPLAPAPFLGECHGALVGGTQRDEQQPAADGHAQDARHRLARDEGEIHDGGGQGVPHRRLGGLFENDRLRHGLRLSGRRLRLLRARKRRERTCTEQRHHDRERDRPSREPHRMTSWSRVSLSIWRSPAYIKPLSARKFARGYNWSLFLPGGRDP